MEDRDSIEEVVAAIGSKSDVPLDCGTCEFESMQKSIPMKAAISNTFCARHSPSDAAKLPGGKEAESAVDNTFGYDKKEWRGIRH